MIKLEASVMNILKHMLPINQMRGVNISHKPAENNHSILLLCSMESFSNFELIVVIYSSHILCLFALLVSLISIILVLSEIRCTQPAQRDL